MSCLPPPRHDGDQLAPLGDVVDVWGARRVIAMRETGEDLPQIAARLLISLGTVKNILAYARENGGAARVPKQGKGKMDDPRWMFAGPRGPGNLYHLERIMEATDDSMELRAVHEQVEDEMEDTPAYSTMTGVLRGRLDYSRKRVRAHYGYARLSASRPSVTIARAPAC